MGFNSFILALLFPVSAFAASTDPLFNQLKDSGEDFYVAGVVCEQAARVALQKEYPAPRYGMETGIAYLADAHTLGELDVVVFRQSDGQAVVIAEVKCWQNLSKGLKKAKAQRSRFQNSMLENNDLDFYVLRKKEVRYRQAQFTGPVKFMTISQKGGTQAGFDRALDHTLDELMALRERIMKCQERGECKRP